MILLVHSLLGALIGQKITSSVLAIVLALFSHYFLDLIPHIEYPIENIKKRQWQKALPDFLWIFMDICLGALLIFAFSKNQPVIFICAVTAILPDGLTLLYKLMPDNRILKDLFAFHQKVHFLENKKFSKAWRIFGQIAITLICVLMLKF